MPLDIQLTIYAATIAAMLTFMRLISGISGSQMIRMSILRTAFISTLYIVIAGFVKISLSFTWFFNFINQYIDLAKELSTIFFLTWAILATYHFALGVIVRLYVRTFRFKDWGTVQNLKKIPIIKKFEDIYGRLCGGDKRDYEVSSARNEKDDIADKIWSKLIDDKRPKNQPTVLTNEDPWKLRRLLIQYCVELANKTDEDINYICCNVSPDNIWRMIKSDVTDDKSLNNLKNRLVFVDAYTTTYGFEDEILLERPRIMEQHEHVDIVRCDSSAGIHSGTAKAFNILKKKTKSNKGTRKPCTVIYDTLSIMSISETEDEVSEFIVHLSAAELTYDMHTIFLEADFEGRNNNVLETLRTCCGKPITVSNNGN